MFDNVRDGDTLYVESVSRLGRSTKDLLNIIDMLTAKGVTLISNKDSIDADSPAGKFKNISAKYQLYTGSIKTDYEILLEKAKAEGEEMRKAEEQRKAEQEHEEEYEDYGYYYDDDAR